jgi:hypothetical protein
MPAEHPVDAENRLEIALNFRLGRRRAGWFALRRYSVSARQLARSVHAADSEKI